MLGLRSVPPSAALNPVVPCTLYRLFRDDGILLYVGISVRPMNRFDQHRGDKSWWTEVSTITMTHFETRTEADQAERVAIRSENPLHNAIHMRTKPSQFVRTGMPVEDIEAVLSECRRIGAAYAESNRVLAEVTRELYDLWEGGRIEGLTSQQLAEVSGVTPARVRMLWKERRDARATT